VPAAVQPPHAADLFPVLVAGTPFFIVTTFVLLYLSGAVISRCNDQLFIGFLIRVFSPLPFSFPLRALSTLTAPCYACSRPVKLVKDLSFF